ncbi:MAG: hypothetical protein MR997_05415 [Bacteroidales bacterium]|nr:hypothetical protein [Bacteroidales bacterium]
MPLFLIAPTISVCNGSDSPRDHHSAILAFEAPGFSSISNLYLSLKRGNKIPISPISISPCLSETPFTIQAEAPITITPFITDSPSDPDSPSHLLAMP